MKNKILYIMLVVLCILINKTNAQQEQNEDNARDWQIILNDETNEQPIKVSDYVWVGCSKISNIDYWSFGNTLSLNKHQILLSYNTYLKGYYIIPYVFEEPNTILSSYTKSIGYGYKISFEGGAIIPSISVGQTDGVWCTDELISAPSIFSVTKRSEYKKSSYTSYSIIPQIELQCHFSKYLGASVGVTYNNDLSDTKYSTFTGFFKVLVGVVK